MPKHLCLTVRFLQPYYHGRADGGEPEWPPSPLRMFQALVAAASARWRDSGSSETATTLLRWLERQSPPLVIAPTGVTADSKYRLYVPDNVADKVAKSWSGGREASIADYRTEKDVRPVRLSDEAVQYLFPSAAESCPHYDILKTAARSITYLGWGIDMVVGDATKLSDNEMAALSGERWEPIEDRSAVRYRVAMQGTLDDLTQKHAAFLCRIGPEGFVTGLLCGFAAYERIVQLRFWYCAKPLSNVISSRPAARAKAAK